MVNQRLQDGGSSILPITQQLAIFSVAKSPESLLRPIYISTCARICVLSLKLIAFHFLELFIM
jgi:hypothetical protein